MNGLPSGAVLLLSGGMDSTTLLWWMRAGGVRLVHTLAVDYGQRHREELGCGRELSALAGAASHKVLTLDLTQIGGSPLTDRAVDVPDATQGRQIDTVVPFRNTLFVTAAAAWAETLGLADIFISPVLDDQAAYRDCRRPYYDALEAALSLGATRDTRVRIYTPFVDWKKADVVRQGLALGVPYEKTHTCYRGTRPACGLCDACAERIAAFRGAGREDPIPYAVPIDWEERR